MLNKKKFKTVESRVTLGFFLILGFYLYSRGVLYMVPYSIWTAVCGVIVVSHYRHDIGVHPYHVIKKKRRGDVEIVILSSLIAGVAGLWLYSGGVGFFLPFALASAIAFLFIWSLMGIELSGGIWGCKTELVIIASTITVV